MGKADSAFDIEALAQGAAALDDRDFRDELSAIRQWFDLLSEAERTATLYAFFQ